MNVRQRRHQGLALLLQFQCPESSQSDQLLLLFSHPEDYDVSDKDFDDIGYHADADSYAYANAGNANLCLQVGNLPL